MFLAVLAVFSYEQLRLFGLTADAPDRERTAAFFRLDRKINRNVVSRGVKVSTAE
jgi:hypothetical protein